MNTVRLRRQTSKLWNVLILLCLLVVNSGSVARAGAMTTGESETQAIQINEPPEIVEGDWIGVTMSMNGYPQPFILGLHATDSDSDALTWQISTAAQNGAASVSGTGAAVEVNYIPDSDFTGTDGFIVQVSDENGGTDSIVVDVTITAMPEGEAQETNPTDPVLEELVTPTPKIVGGAPADPGEYPWQVALVDGISPDLYATQFCGGMLIAPQWVLTAAHCITESNGSVSPVGSLDVVAGIYNLASPAAGYQRRDVILIIRHPSFGFATLDNDLALMKLNSPVSLGGSGETKTASIPLVPANIGDLTGSNAWVSGWGNTESIPAYPTQLHEVQVPIIANSICNDPSHYDGYITANMLCAGYDAGGHDACQGDSGGPMVVSSSGQWKLAGIVSWGIGCADPFSPGVYTRVSQYVNWINSNVANYDPPVAFSRSSPANGAIDQSTSPTLSWEASLGTTLYEYCYDTSDDNSCSTWISNGTATSKALSGLLAGMTYYWHVRAVNLVGTTYANGGSTAFGSFTTVAIIDPKPIKGDFNGDGLDETGIFSSGNGTWFIKGTAPFVYGQSGDIPVPADYNGDGKDDIAVFRPTNSTWYLYGIGPRVYGTVGDVPVVADYDGDGKADIAVFRPTNSTWYLYGIGPRVYGTVGDVPVVADYDGDGKADIAVFRPTNSTWYLYGIGPRVYGTVGDIPVVGDYNGDGIADIAVFRPTNSTWYIYGVGPSLYGTAGDIPVIGDYTGDGKADITVFRPGNNTFYIRGVGPVAY